MTFWAVASVLVGSALAQPAAFPGGPFAQSVSTGKVTGQIVQDSGGAALSGVGVTLTAINAGGGGIPAAAARTYTSAADGTFTIPNLAQGRYEVCVKDQAGQVIDPCSWSDSLTTVTASAGASASNFTVRVKKASTVTVRVNDVAKALGKKSGNGPSPHVLVGAFDAHGAFHQSRETQNDSSGITYQLSIPVDSPVRMTVYSAQVQLATSANATVPAQGYTTTLVQPSGSSQTNSLTFSTKGKN